MGWGEDDLIARYFAPLAGLAGLGLRDDAGLLPVPAGCELVITKDVLVAGVHFFPDDPPDTIARKALGVNLSDLAAKAATPAGFLLALALPSDLGAPWLQTFASALGVDAARYGCPLIGGDTVSTPGPLMVSITALGLVRNGTMLPRTGARVGDRIYVSGTVGDGALGLRVRQAERDGGGLPWIQSIGAAHRAVLRDRYWVPRPRLALTPALAHAHAGMDVSDGLVGDLAKMLRVSGVAGRMDVTRVPLSAAAQAAVLEAPELREAVLTGGDDYEILATVPADKVRLFEAAARDVGVVVTAIGDVTAGSAALAVVDATGASLAFRHMSYAHM